MRDSEREERYKERKGEEQGVCICGGEEGNAREDGRAEGRETDACDPSFFEKQLLSTEETGKRNVLVSACVCVGVCVSDTNEKERESRKEEQERQARSDGAR